MLKTVLYISSLKENTSSLDIENIYHKTLINNNNSNIFGALIFHDNNFFQILEGENQVVNKLYSKIKKDPRHHKIIELLNQEISEYSFNSYGTGFNICNNRENFYLLKDYVDRIHNTKAKKLLLSILNRFVTMQYY